MTILAVRLGAMGDAIHALPAVCSLRASFPAARLLWLIEPQWMPLLDGNPAVDRAIPFDRRSASSVVSALREIRRERPAFAVDFQGLLKSAIPARLACPEVFGFDRTFLREKAAHWFYARTASPTGAHVVDMNLDLAQAAGARRRVISFPLPAGSEEGRLPRAPYLLACPFAGWAHKQWPIERYAELGRLSRAAGLPLVLNGPPGSEAALAATGCDVHVSGLAGLIHATRGAAAIAGVDSGPMHLAAALGIPGVAVFGPTDPARNGPYGGSIAALREANAETTYKRRPETADSMAAIGAGRVFAELRLLVEAPRS